jgi:hypothetical protein
VCVCARARLGVCLPQQAVALFVLRHWNRFKPGEVANVLWALAVLKACPPEVWRVLMEKLALVPAASFDEADQHQIYQAFLLLDSQGGVADPAADPPARRLTAGI